MTNYESPEIYEVGSLTELTAGGTQGLNKVGKKADAHTAAIETLIGVDIVGSLTNA